MFDRGLDSEQAFGHHQGMSRTGVRRRRRIAAAMLSVALGLIVSAPVAGALGRHGNAAGVAEAGVRPAGRSEHVYVVRAGDTVWTIAERVAGGDDPRPWVDAIAMRNGIEAGALVPGQSLILPRVA
jgi:nucleoid-associated protein YgaU